MSNPPLSFNLTNGTYFFIANVSDPRGHINFTYIRMYISNEIPLIRNITANQSYVEILKNISISFEVVSNITIAEVNVTVSYPGGSSVITLPANNGTHIFEYAPSVAGWHNITVQCNDSSLQTGENTVFWYNDQTGPTTTITTPIADEITNQADIEFEVDDGIGIDSSTHYVFYGNTTWNSTEQNLGTDTDYTFIGMPSSGVFGTQWWMYAYAVDSLGNEGITDKVNMTYDLMASGLTFVGPSGLLGLSVY